jgi:PBP1b-binding outer membrane lipoprotein LpoB
MKKISIILIIVFILGGCARTVKNLKTDPAGSYSFTVNLYYEEVYRISAEYMENDRAINSVESRLYSDKKEAIVYEIHAPNDPLFRWVYLVCEMKAISDNKTLVDIYYNSVSDKAALSLKNELLSHEDE